MHILKYLTQQTKQRKLYWKEQEGSGEYTNSKKDTLQYKYVGYGVNNVPLVYVYRLESVPLTSLTVWDIENGDIGDNSSTYKSTHMIDNYYIKKLLSSMNTDNGITIREKLEKCLSLIVF